jgi:hypothetical protein
MGPNMSETPCPKHYRPLSWFGVIEVIHNLISPKVSQKTFDATFEDTGSGSTVVDSAIGTKATGSNQLSTSTRQV